MHIKFLHCFAPDDGAGNGAPAAPAAPAAAPAQSADDIAAAVLTAIESRQQRAGDAVLKSMAQQYGMTADELSGILKAKQAEKAKQLPADVQAQIDAANAKVQKIQLTAEVNKLGAAMGLIDADVALTLMDRAQISYKDDGTMDGVQSALDALKEKKPYLFGNTQPKAWGQQRTGGAPEPETTARDDIRKLMFGH